MSWLVGITDGLNVLTLWTFCRISLRRLTRMNVRPLAEYYAVYLLIWLYHSAHLIRSRLPENPSLLFCARPLKKRIKQGLAPRYSLTRNKFFKLWSSENIAFVYSQQIFSQIFHPSRRFFRGTGTCRANKTRRESPSLYGIDVAVLCAFSKKRTV